MIVVLLYMCAQTYNVHVVIIIIDVFIAHVQSLMKMKTMISSLMLKKVHSISSV